MYALIPFTAYGGSKFQYLDPIPKYNQLGDCNYLCGAVDEHYLAFKSLREACVYALGLHFSVWVVEEDHAERCVVIDWIIH